MFVKICKFISIKNYLPIFISLLICYFAIGTFGIFHTPIAGDELAHLSGAHGISQGQTINVEHPPFLKMLNGVMIAVFFGDYHSEDQGQWSRSIDFLINSKYDPYTIICASRFVYLVFNSLLLLWLIVYTSFFRLINARFSLLLGFIYTFSPSIWGHNFLLVFDVAGAITALMTILSFSLLSLNFSKLNRDQFRSHTILFTLSLTLALNVKFSNFVLVPILLLFGSIYAVFWLKQKGYEKFKNILNLFTTSFVSVVGLTWLFYTISYFNTPSPHPHISKFIGNVWVPFFRYGQGITMTMDRSQSRFENFVDDRFVALTYPQFASRVFWFKENPIIILFVLICTGFSLYKLFRWIKKQKLHNFNSTNTSQLSFSLTKEVLENFSKNLIIPAFLLSFPLAYLWSSKDTTFTIGYRHFYPLLIFIYTGLAWVLSKILISRLLLVRLFSLSLVLGYIYFAILGIPQGLSYTNPLWTKEKWRLATDSTITWGEQEGYVFDYLLTNKLLKTTDPKTEIKDWNVVFDSNSGPNIHVHLIKVLGKQDTTNTGRIFKNLTESKISDIKAEYIVVDGIAFQRLVSTKSSNDISRQNLDWLNSRKPIFTNDNVIFVYRI